MTLYETTLEQIRLQKDEEALRRKREDQARRIAETTALLTRVGELIAADEKTLAALHPTLTFTEDSNATLTIDGEFTFTLMARQQYEVTLLPTICTAGCHAIIADREEFLEFVTLHLALNHTPVPPQPEIKKTQEPSQSQKRGAS